MPVVKMPDGTKVEFPDDMSKEQIREKILQKHPEAADMAKRKKMEREAPGPLRWIQAATRGADAGMMLGYDDEIGAAMLAPIEAGIDWAKGEGFDIARTYERLQREFDEQKDQRREEFPIASAIGEVSGGLATGGSLAKQGVSLAGRAIPVLSKAAPRATSVGTAAAEGAAYGAAYGSGEADPGERIEGAAEGAALGAVTGAGVQAVGNAVATRAAHKAASKAAQSSDELKQAAGDMFDASEASGVSFMPEAVERVKKRLTLAAGRINDKLRPKTAGYVEDIKDLFSGRMSLEDFEEFRQTLTKEAKSASANDARTLNAMKRTLDNFADTAKAKDFVGDESGIKLLKKAREQWAQARKTEILEDIVDMADVDTGQYTQSGLANAIRKRMKSLYGQIKKGKVKGFTQDEVALIRQMAKGGSASGTVKLLAKFAPRGVVSFGLGQIVGTAVPGGNLLLPMAGEAAQRVSDRAAITAAESLKNAVSSGAPIVGKQTTQKAAPFIAGSVEANRAGRRKVSNPR